MKWAKSLHITLWASGHSVPNNTHCDQLYQERPEPDILSALLAARSAPRLLQHVRLKLDKGSGGEKSTFDTISIAQRVEGVLTGR